MKVYNYLCPKNKCEHLLLVQCCYKMYISAMIQERNWCTFSKILHIPLALFLLQHTLLVFESPDWKIMLSCFFPAVWALSFVGGCQALQVFDNVYCKVCNNYLAVKFWRSETLALFVPFYLCFSQSRSTHLRECLSYPDLFVMVFVLQSAQNTEFAIYSSQSLCHTCHLLLISP